MGKRAESLVWKRARAGAGDLLMLVKIADLADDEGRNAWPEVPGLMKYCRLSERGAQYTLQRLERTGEIEIEYNQEGREITLRGGRTFRPKWFIHVRCVCAWEAYTQEGQQPATLAGSLGHLRTGRPRRKPATLAGSLGRETRNSCTQNPQPSSAKPARSRKTYKEGSSNDPLVEQEQGAAHPPTPETAGAPPQLPPQERPDQNIGVITKIAHDAIDQIGPTHPDLTEAVKSLCARWHIAYNSDVVRKAIESACWQRTQAHSEAS